MYMCCVSKLRAISTVSLVLQEDMLDSRRTEFQKSIEKLYSWDGFVEALDKKKMVLTPWCVVHSAFLGACTVSLPYVIDVYKYT